LVLPLVLNPVSQVFHNLKAKDQPH